jgi:AcrR family transcriptional regulator
MLPGDDPFHQRQGGAMERPPSIFQEERESAHDQRVEEILNQARLVMRETRELSLTQVARALGVKPPSLYEYFDGKMAIYDALYVEAYREFEAQVRPSLLRADNLWDAIAAGIESYLRFAWQNPALFSIGFQRPPPGFEPSGESNAIRQVILERVRGSMLQHLEGTKLDISNEEALDLLLAAGHGLIVLQAWKGIHAPIDRERVKHLSSILIDSLRKAWQVDPEGRPKLNAWGLPA